MAVKTRTPRTSSGARKERKEATRLAQGLREDSNREALRNLPNGEHFLTRTGADGKPRAVRPSVALRSAKRAQRFAALAASADN